MSTTIGQIARELAATNPWWRHPTQWIGRDPDLRAAENEQLDYHPPVLADIRPDGLYLLRGPRRVGKTVAVKRSIARLIAEGVPPTAIVRVAADGWSVKDVRTMVQNTALPPIPAGYVRWWFIDEITAAGSDWDQQIKWLRDNNADFADACVVLTGSDAADLTRAAGTLAGRRGRSPSPDRTLLPMGFRTFARILHPDLPEAVLRLDQLHTRDSAETYASLLAWLNELVGAWDRYLAYGGFPTASAAACRGEPYPEPFADALLDVISRDAFSSSRLNRATTTALLDRLWTAMGSPVSFNAIGRDVGTTVDTVIRHVGYLSDAYLAWRCPQRHPERWVPRERTQDKIYAIDPGIARLTHLRNLHRDDIDPTVLSEMMLGVAILRAAMTGGRSWDDDQHLFFVRTPARKEIDFVSEHLAGAAVESKYVDTGKWRSEAATVNASEWAGILATRSVLDTSQDGAWAVPAAVLAYLIDT